MDLFLYFKNKIIVIIISVIVSKVEMIINIVFVLFMKKKFNNILYNVLMKILNIFCIKFYIKLIF